MLIVIKLNWHCSVSRVAKFTIASNCFLCMSGGWNSSTSLSVSLIEPLKYMIKLACRRHMRGTLVKCCVHMNVVQHTWRTW